jgi:hypothetical protein
MATDPQHCPTCQTEYIAGIAACADCGGALSPGPLDRYTGAPAPSRPAATPATGAFDAVLAQLPGIQADRAVRALLLEEIACFVECQGLTKTYKPGTPPTEPFAVTLPVTVHVRQADLDTAREVIASLDSEDLIGEQWSDEEIAEAAEAAGVPPEEVVMPDVEPQIGQAEDPEAGAPQAQGSSMIVVAVVAIVVIGLLLLLGRQ